MLKALELENVDGLFSHLPERLRLDRVDLPEPLSEVELVQYFRELGRLNHRIPPSHSFLGAGPSRRFSPAIVNQVISRPDFYTTYTPYQAEASQGTLQATYEFQTMIALLTGLDVANASLYDGATSLAEATAMAVAHTNRQNVVVAGALHPEYAQVLQTYSEAQHYEILRVAPGVDGRVDPAKLEQAVTSATVDGEGRRGYVLTLQAREQHIRREHATSNITTNHALMALAATVYLAHMGGAGLKQLAELSAQRAHYLAGQLVERKGYRLAFEGPFLWEFVLRTPYPAEQAQTFMLERGVLGGLPLGRFFPELSDALLVSVTELNHPRAIERYLEVLA